MSKYTDWIIERNIKPVSIENKEELLFDLMEIDNSTTSRADIISYCNGFIMESVQLIVNAIELFEKGFFDSAYYSLRSSIDISTTIVYFTDMPEEIREKQLAIWKSGENFPFRNKLVKDLSNDGNIFSDMYIKMPDFFEEAKELSNQLNKYVHKQGYRYFYVYRNNPLSQYNTQKFILDFIEYTKQCIRVVAVMRLAIDPMPLLLNDDDMLYRLSDTLTKPYSNNFLEKYLDEKTINEYKQTNVYKDTYSELMVRLDKKPQSVFDVVHNHYINTEDTEELMSNLHLMPYYDAIATIIVCSSEKIVNVYYNFGWIWLFTNRNSNRKSMSMDGSRFKGFSEQEDKINIPYDEAFISVLKLDDEYFFIEHNEKLTTDEFGQLFGMAFGAHFKMKNSNKEE